MSYSHPQGRPAAQLGASYYPGRDDDFQIPVVSPMPQRNNPEIPENIAQNLAHFELEARPSSTVSELPSPMPQNGPGFSQGYATPRPGQGSRQPSASAADIRHTSTSGSPRPIPEDEPSFSSFPIVRDRKISVPPSDEEKEEILEKARDAVLNSNDPDMQLAWAQDTLAYIDTSQQNELRLSEFRSPRPQTPKVERRLRIDAVNIVEFLAQQHHPKAEYIRGTWLEFGRFGFEMDKREAFRCYSRSAQNGYARSEYRMGMQFESSHEIEKAVRHYNLGVQAADAASTYRMGMMTLLGQHGQIKDYTRGLDMIRFSAEHADENAPQGAYVYGMLHIRELPQVTVPDQYLAYDVDTARLNIEKAAYLGFAKAQVKMGTAYELSELSCAFDPVLSLHYNNLAARQGEADAEMAISKWFLSGSEGFFNKNEAMAFAYAQRAASTGLTTAEFAMGYFYEVGIHVPSSLKEARAWYSKAADHGNKDAAGRIDGISRSKTLSRKDHDKIAMARIKSQRGTQDPRDQQNPSSTPVSMPHIPETYGQSYSNPPGPAPNRNGYGPPYGQQGPSPGSASSIQMPQPGGRPVYGAPSPAPGSGYPPGPQARPYTSPPSNQPYGQPPNPMHAQTIGPPGPGYGPQYPPQQGYRPNPNMPPLQQRTPQGPPHMPQGPPQLPHGPPQMPQGPPQNRIPSGPMPPRPSPSPLPDIGFTAPPDLTGADRRRLPPGAPSNRPPPGRGGYGAVAHAASPRPPVPQTPQAPQAPQAPRPPRLDSAPRPATLTKASANKLAAPVSNPTPPISTGPTKPPGQSSGNKPPKAPGKGPSTFEEMGVPSHKKNDDCVVM